MTRGETLNSEGEGVAVDSAQNNVVKEIGWSTGSSHEACVDLLHPASASINNPHNCATSFSTALCPLDNRVSCTNSELSA